MKVTDQSYYMDGYKQAALTTAKTVIKKDWDMMFLYDGAEGSGKSTCAMQDAYFCDPTLSLDRVVFTPQEFRHAVNQASPYQAVIYDEAYTGLSSRASMTLINRTLVSMLAEIRQKNLFIFVVMPTFFDLDKYVALWRSRALIHVYTADGFERGYFAFYNTDRKKDLYINGKKFYSYAKPKPNFVGRFVNYYPLNEKAYRRKKKASLLEREKKKEEASKRQEIEAELFTRIMELDLDLPHKVKMAILNLPPSTYFRKMKQYEDMKEIS